MKIPRPNFAPQTLHGHAKRFLRNLEKILARALEKFRQPWPHCQN